jgi:hypothetical protein
MAKKTKAKENWLLFVDTNILLDFYRLPGESAIRQLKALERHQTSLILGDQVRVEFLTNRQKAITKGIEQIKKPERHQYPSIIAEYQAAKMVSKHLSDATKKHGEVRNKIENILRNPHTQDAVYQHLNRIFDVNSDLNLSRFDKLRVRIVSLARKRFILGYPPRKPGDTSIGDAVNWEWIIHCAASSKDNHHVLVVSRDSDYGLTFGNEVILNDWLRREFKERISRKRKIEITNRLTVALKRLDEALPKEDEDAEQALIGSRLKHGEYYKNIGRLIAEGDTEKSALQQLLEFITSAPPGEKLNIGSSQNGTNE